MAEQRGRVRASQKLLRDDEPKRATSVQYPDRLREGEDKNDDVATVKGNPGQSVNQSVFSMITRAGSNTDFHRRFDDESSDSDEGSKDTDSPRFASKPLTQKVQEAVSSREDEPQSASTHTHTGIAHPLDFPHSEKPAAVPGLQVELPDADDPMSQSMLLPPKPTETTFSKTQLAENAPVMSQMLQAQAHFSDALADSSRTEKETPLEVDQTSDPKSLAEQLKDIFGFEEPEDVLAEYPCWLTQSVLLQGYMYITQHHVCFYAYAPKKSNVVAKSGYLLKRGKSNPKYSRYWFQLKGDELSYRTDPNDPYFRSGNIDLRYGISASLNEPKDRSKGSKDFAIVTPQREYHFRADSVTSAREWVKQLQRVIFRSHNKGDSVKISMPIENIMDVEALPVMDIAETIKVRVVDAEEGFAVFAVEEYFFTFFGDGDDARKLLQTLVEDTVAKNIPEDLLTASPAHEESRSREPSRITQKRKSYDAGQVSPSDPGTPVLREHMRATIGAYSPITGAASPRASGEWSRGSLNLDRRSVDFKRKSLDVGRRSMDFPRSHFRRAQSERGRKGTSVDRSRAEDTTSESEMSSNAGKLPGTRSVSSKGTVPVSGSQILSRSDVFQSPTIDRLRRSGSQSDGESAQHSPVSGRKPSGAPSQIRIQPPSRTQSERNTSGGQVESEGGAYDLMPVGSSPTLQQLVKAGNYPLQRAAGFAGYLSKHSKRLSTRFATESRGYVDKVSGMWAGGHRHYSEEETVMPNDPLDSSEAEDNADGSGDRFRAYFALPQSEKLKATFFGWLHRGVPIHGKIYISRGRFCFRSLFPGSKTKMVLPMKDIENVHKEKGFRFSYSGLVLVVRGHEELFFDFKSDEIRNDCAVTLHHLLEHSKDLLASSLLTEKEQEEAEMAKAEHQLLQAARKSNREENREPEPTARAQPILFDDPRASIVNFKPTESLRITCLTIGSRGDVQPYIALCKGLIKEGHKPKIATHREFQGWVEKHGIAFAPVEGDPAELMRICVENGVFTFSFLKEASAKFRGWIDELLSSAWHSCQDTDILIESPSAMAGTHIAEALGVPYYRAFTMPWTRTRAYPHAFVVPAHKKGGTYNEMSYFLFDQVFWKAIAGQVNRWRKKELGLRSTDLTKMAPSRVPFLYNFSPKVVPPPLDYSDWVHITGYWFLDEASAWQPPKDLVDFIAKARADGKKIVYIGFGSIVVSDPAALTKTVIESVKKADVRCILSKGWSDRLGNHDAGVPEVPLPPEILQIKSAPHDWLFKQIDAATHHGGAGTTGASLRAGLPTIVKPFFGDQFFFGTRIEDLGVGICLKKLNVSVFSRALWEATHSQRMITKANRLGEQIREEDGVATAIQTIYRDLEYAKSLIKRQAHVTNDDKINDEEWTLIGDEDDPELIQRIQDFDISHLHGGLRKSIQFNGRESLDLGA